MIRWKLLVIILILLGVRDAAPGASAAEADPYWQGWRDRQRAELTALPKPPQPPTGEGAAIDRFLAAHWSKMGIQPPTGTPNAVAARHAAWSAPVWPPLIILSSMIEDPVMPQVG